MAWRPTPKSRLIVAKRLDPASGQWLDCAFSDLRAGDIFKAFRGDVQVDLLTGNECEPDDVGIAEADAQRDLERGEGYGVLATAGRYPDILRRVAA